MSQDVTPDKLHEVQYSAHILSEILAWPAKGNIELLADCLISLMKAKRLSGQQAHDYMVRAIRLAKEQGIKVDRMFFMNGEYVNVRPPRTEGLSTHKPVSDEEWNQAQASRKEFFASDEYRQFLLRMKAKGM